jgi:hypothetical protein
LERAARRLSAPGRKDSNHLSIVRRVLELVQLALAGLVPLAGSPVAFTGVQPLGELTEHVQDEPAAYRRQLLRDHPALAEELTALFAEHSHPRTEVGPA